MQESLESKHLVHGFCGIISFPILVKQVIEDRHTILLIIANNFLEHLIKFQ